MSLPLSSIENRMGSGSPALARKRRKEAPRRGAGEKDENEMDVDSDEVVPQTPVSPTGAENTNGEYVSEDENQVVRARCLASASNWA